MVTLQVYIELDHDRENKEFNSVLTSLDMIDQIKMQIKEVLYHRIPLADDYAPAERVSVNGYVFLMISAAALGRQHVIVVKADFTHASDLGSIPSADRKKGSWYLLPLRIDFEVGL